MASAVRDADDARDRPAAALEVRAGTSASRACCSVERFKTRLKRGEYFPPFLYISVINSCNLRCQGCWVDVAGPQQHDRPGQLNRVITDAKRHGNSFFGILGGEPFMHPRAAGHPRGASRLLLPGLHQRPVHHGRDRAAAARARQRDAAQSASKAPRSSATSAAAGERLRTARWGLDATAAAQA